MASFICTLSLFLLVLANGYFTAPIIHETTSLSNELDRETTEAPKHVARSSSDTMELETTSPGDSKEENIPQGLRLAPNDDKDESHETPALSDTLKHTTEKPIIKETTPGQHHSGSHSNGAEGESEEETGNEKPESGKTYQRRGMSDESTTTTTIIPIMSSHLTSSSTIIPEVHSPSSTSTVKYIGLLKNDEPQPTEGEHSGKPNKPRPKPEEPTATLGAVIVGQESVPDIGKSIDGIMQYDDNTIPSITDSPTTMKGKPKPAKIPLNEGEKSSQSEEEKSD